MNFDPEIKRLRTIGGCQFDNAFLAGGAITATFTKHPVNDLDFYFRDYESFRRAVDDAYDDGRWCVALTPRAITFGKSGDRPTIQLMYFKFFETAEAIFESFDFTACMGALDTASGELIFHPRFMADACARELHFNHRTEFPLASGLRVQKYLERGYTISGDEWLKVLLACQFNTPTGWEELQTQLGGHYTNEIKLAVNGRIFNFDNVIAALSERGKVDPQLVIPGALVLDSFPYFTIEPPSTYDEAIKRIAAMRGE